MRISVFLILFALSSCKTVIDKIGGDFSYPVDGLSEEAKEVVRKSFDGLDESCVIDSHMHIAGLGKNGSGIELNPNSQNLMKPMKYLKTQVYMSAADIEDQENADNQYIQRLTKLWEFFPVKWKGFILAFDKHYLPDGIPVPELTNFYVPNEYIMDVANKNSNRLLPAISIHPDRKDAISELEKWAQKGAKMVKWLPNAMRIDPSSENSLKFLSKMKDLNMVLLTHVGEERAVDGDEFQHLGNPLLLRPALDLGVKILMAHLASLGDCADFDNENKPALCFDLFWRLFTNPKYEKNLFGEISGTTIHTRLGVALKKVLEHPEIQHRLVNGSDYPLPAVNWIYRTGQMEKMGFITEKEKDILNDIYKHNPLLFDFVSKRILKHPETKAKLSNSAFIWPKELLDLCN